MLSVRLFLSLAFSHLFLFTTSHMFQLTMVPTLLSCAACRRLGAHHPLSEQAVLQRMALHQMTQQAKEGEAQTAPAPALKQVSNQEHIQHNAEHQMCFAQLQQQPVGCVGNSKSE